MPAAAMKTLPFVSLLLFCSLESATAAEYMVKIDTFGAYNKEDLKTAVRYSAEHDTDAVVQLMYEGKLVPVDEGMKLFSTNYNLFEPRYIQVREKGSTKPFWVLLEQVQQIEQKETPEPSPSVRRAQPANPVQQPPAPANTELPKQAGIEWGKALARKNIENAKQNVPKGKTGTLNSEKVLKAAIKESVHRYSDPEQQAEFAAAAHKSSLAEWNRLKPKSWK